jgi:hypothetical protein
MKSTARLPASTAIVPQYLPFMRYHLPPCPASTCGVSTARYRIEWYASLRAGGCACSLIAIQFKRYQRYCAVLITVLTNVYSGFVKSRQIVPCGTLGQDGGTYPKHAVLFGQCLIGGCYVIRF